ncbi:laminin G domain-containing protein, partial [candidate division WWE3 bacterium]|nr:laminin G domain-containing protein [candidate division WWE3 bacterium]
TGDFSLSVWFRHNSNQTASGGDYLVSRHNTAGYKLFMNENEQICFGGDDDATFTSAGTCSLLDYDDSQWHHAVAVKNSTTEYLYIDGVLVDTDTAEAGSHSGSSPTLYVGIDSDGASRSWQGWIDEVKIFDTALTAAQVKAQFASSADVKGVSASFGPDDSWLTKGLVGYWKMDETSWTNDCLTTSPVTDASGNSNNGMACPASTGPTGGAAGKFGKAGEFDGVDDRVNAGSGQMLDDLTTFTYCAWIYPRSMGESNDGFIISKSLSTGSTKVLQIRSGTTNSIAFDVDRATTNSDAVSTANTLTLNTWQHVCGTYNEADGPKVYKEGVEVSYSSKIVGAGATTNDNSRDLIIGNRGNSQRTFDGFIDEARVYNRVLSPVEIQRLSEWGPGPVLYYKFDENTGTITVNDSSVNSNSGTMANMASTVWAPGKYSSSLDFDGTNDYVSAGDASLLKITGPITVQAWVKRRTNSGVDRILAKLGDAGSRSYWLTAGDGNTDFIVSSDGTAISATATTSTVIGADTWTHVA